MNVQLNLRPPGCSFSHSALKWSNNGGVTFIFFLTCNYFISYNSFIHYYILPWVDLKCSSLRLQWRIVSFYFIREYTSIHTMRLPLGSYMKNIIRNKETFFVISPFDVTDNCIPWTIFFLLLNSRIHCIGLDFLFIRYFMRKFISFLNVWIPEMFYWKKYQRKERY